MVVNRILGERIFEGDVPSGMDAERKQEYRNLEEMLEIAKEEGLQEGQERLETERKRADAAESEIGRLRQELERIKAGMPAQED